MAIAIIFSCYPTGSGNTLKNVEGKFLKIIPRQRAPSALSSYPYHCFSVSTSVNITLPVTSYWQMKTEKRVNYDDILCLTLLWT